MVTYRIYTEDIGRDKIVKLVSSQFQSYSMFAGNGFWKGNAEPLLVVEIITDCKPETENRIKRIAEEIKYVNQQEMVLVTKTNCQTFEI